jgi:hypothetical protein
MRVSPACNLRIDWPETRLCASADIVDDDDDDQRVAEEKKNEIEACFHFVSWAWELRWKVAAARDRERASKRSVVCGAASLCWNKLPHLDAVDGKIGARRKALVVERVGAVGCAVEEVRVEVDGSATRRVVICRGSSW